jgi:anti-sigma-K factor RskA
VTLPSAPTAGASLEITGGEGRLRVSDFASLSTSQSYELWNLGEEDPRPAGLFRAAENGSATLTIDQPVKAGDRVLVAIEPGGGSQQPTSKPIASATVPA